jgi:hypothetical protein
MLTETSTLKSQTQEVEWIIEYNSQLCPLLLSREGLTLKKIVSIASKTFHVPLKDCLMLNDMLIGSDEGKKNFSIFYS